MKEIKIKVTGISPMLQSCDRLADPLDAETIAYKKLTSIRGKAKTTDIILEIAKKQYINSVYYSSASGVHIPSINVKKTMEEGAKLSRNGDKIRKGVMIFDAELPLEYGEKLTPLELWNSGQYLDKRSVVVGQAKVMCYRPKFAEWSFVVDVVYDESIIEGNQIVEFLAAAGQYVGLGGFRPAKNGMFGRFNAEEIS